MLPFSPADLDPTGTRNYHWTPANQRAFLEHLAITGLASHAAQVVAMSKNSAYRLRLRGDGLAFSIGWEAALMVARGRLVDELMERAIEGYEETATRSEDGREIKRVKYDSRLAMNMLSRFDKRIDRDMDGRSEALPASLLAFARIAAQDFEAFLDLIEAGGAAAQLSLFLAARADLASVLHGSHLPQISGNLEEEDEDKIAPEPAQEEPDLTPQEEAAAMNIWYCDYSGTWRTNFPPPEDFIGDFEGQFGERGYERELCDEEEEMRQARLDAEIAPLRAAGEAARRAWFGLPEVSEDFTQRRGDAEEDDAILPTSGEPEPMDDLTMSAMTEDEVTDTVSADLRASARNRSDDAETGTVEDELATPLRPPPDDPTIRVIHCKPQINYAAHGMIPPHIARELGLDIYDRERI